MIRYKKCNAFSSPHFDSRFARNDIQFGLKDHKQKQEIIYLENKYHPYSLICKLKHFFDDNKIMEQCRVIFKLWMQKTATMDNNLKKHLTDQIFGFHKGERNQYTNLTSKSQKNVVSKIQRFLKYIHNNIHVHYRRHMWGFLNPNISYREWILANYYDVIFKDENKQIISIIKIPFYIGTKSIDDAVRRFCNINRSDYLPLTPSPNKNLDSIISTYESYHRYEQ